MNATGRAAPILRVRTGCLTCRGRKKKCDESRPVCRGCVRNHLTCLWPTGKTAASGSGQRKRGQKNARGATQQQTRPSNVVRENNADYDGTHDIRLHPCQPSGSRSSASSISSSDNLSWDLLDSHEHDQVPEIGTSPHELYLDHDSLNLSNSNLLDVQDRPLLEDYAPAVTNLAISRSVSILPGHGHDSFELLSHYLSRTANSMSNGSTEVNPFVTQLVPLAFGSDLILQLILTQSAAHRAVLNPASALELHGRHYGRSLGLFRKSVMDYIAGGQANLLQLTLGALILCFTEVREIPINWLDSDYSWS